MPVISLQELRRRIYHKAKSEKDWRFWGIYVHVCRMETLWEAYRKAKANGGAPGVDGRTFEAIERDGLEKFIGGIREELIQQTYVPQPNRQVNIPKSDGKTTRRLGIPTVKDRVVQGALKLVLEPIFEPDFCDNTFGYRSGRNCAEALHRVTMSVIRYRLTRIIDVDLSNYFNNIRHHLLLKQIVRRVKDDQVMWLLRRILKVQGKKGILQGSPLSPLLANWYLAEVDRVFKKAEEKTQVGNYPRVIYTRFADDIIIAVGRHPRWANLEQQVMRRLNEELDKLAVKVNKEKTKVVELTQGECFSYLGFDCRLVKSRRGKPLLLKTPRMRKRTELLRGIRDSIRRAGQKTARELIRDINPKIAGWVNYFRTGHSYWAFCYVRKYVESRVRRFAMRRRLRLGFGWERWSRQMIYGDWGLFNDYRIRYYQPSSESAFQLTGV